MGRGVDVEFSEVLRAQITVDALQFQRRVFGEQERRVPGGTSSTLRHVGFAPPGATLEAATAPAPRPDCAMQPVRRVPSNVSSQNSGAMAECVF